MRPGVLTGRAWRHRYGMRRDRPAVAEVVIRRTDYGALCAADPATGEAWAYHARADRDGARWIWRQARRVGAVVTWASAAACGATVAGLLAAGEGVAR